MSNCGRCPVCGFRNCDAFNESGCDNPKCPKNTGKTPSGEKTIKEIPEPRRHTFDKGD